MKSKTHIYMANMILKEIKETGCVYLKDYGSFRVPKDISSAIINNPKAFRAGAVGPDFFPDMIVGQTIIHPFNSGKWLDRMETELLSMSRSDPEWEKAYAFYLGFHMHYAGDMFGHDYVNNWAGGSFPDITDAVTDPEKARNIVRHILIETYMDEKVPANEDLSLSAPIDFVFRCFASEDAAKLYPESKTNVLKYMIELKAKIHKKTQDKTIRALDLVNYFPSWEKDIDSAIIEWLKLWERIARYFTEKNGMSKTKKDIVNWFKEWVPKLTFIPKWVVSILKAMGDILEFLNIFKIIEKALKAQFKSILMSFVYAVTGITEEDIDKLIEIVENIFKNPKLYLNNGILYDTKDITDQLDKDFGNYGISQNYHDQTFIAYAHCLDMCRIAIMGAKNLNDIIGKYYKGAPLFKERSLRTGFNKLDITIKTGSNSFSGTDDNVYFAVILKDGRVLEIMLDKAGYNDFENSNVDTYRFELPETVYYDDIEKLRVRKDKMINDDWKMQHIKVIDVGDGFCLADEETNVWLKKNASYDIKHNFKFTTQKISIDARVMDHLYSLDGACPAGQPGYKPWNEPKFFINISCDLRKDILLPLFKLDDMEKIPSVFYSVHAKDIGWMCETFSGETAGTTGESRRLEAVRIRLNVTEGDICYSVHAANLGWLPYVKNGEIAGTIGESRRIEAIKIRLENLPGFSVMYRVHMKQKGWSDWKLDDAVAGTTGESRRIEAIEVKIVKC